MQRLFSRLIKLTSLLFLKCQLKKESQKAQVRIPGLLSAAPNRGGGLCFCSPLCADQLEQTLMAGHPTALPLFLLSGQSLSFISHRHQGRVITSPGPSGTLVWSHTIMVAPFFWTDVLGVGKTKLETKTKTKTTQNIFSGYNFKTWNNTFSNFF